MVRTRYAVANPSTYLYPGPERVSVGVGWAVPDLAACPDYDEWHYGLEERNTYMSMLTPEEIRAQLLTRNVSILLGDQVRPQRTAMSR